MSIATDKNIYFLKWHMFNFKININFVIGHTMLPNFYQATKKSPEWYLNGLQNNYILKTYGRNSKCLEGCKWGKHCWGVGGRSWTGSNEKK